MLKILVADDNSNIQRMVALAFAKRGIDVTAVGNGEAAVRRLADLSPDLVLADIFMPVRNGYEVCEYVKQDARFSHIPVILLVGAFDPLDEKEARRVGADGVLKKPFVPPDPLIAMVTSVLERNPRLAAELAIANRAAAEPPPPEALHPHVEAAPIPPAKFPEPSPQEATETYGFGTGRRAPEDRSKEAVGPTALAEEETQDEFDQAATTRDCGARTWISKFPTRLRRGRHSPRTKTWSRSPSRWSASSSACRARRNDPSRSPSSKRTRSRIELHPGLLDQRLFRAGRNLRPE